ncbi:hypothetical protein POM88_006096 [Heracleum sosnowskyi]|uniref:Uncharacterized protein n=1 Tax=Heracleum sosnowskyi TaxID=360622 RepID=A0AAD8J365_9APIA|nr:hypothetical protein POM88_006096 [Heracleum sosnowskyi]
MLRRLHKSKVIEWKSSYSSLMEVAWKARGANGESFSFPFKCSTTIILSVIFIMWCTDFVSLAAKHFSMKWRNCTSTNIIYLIRNLVKLLSFSKHSCAFIAGNS